MSLANRINALTVAIAGAVHGPHGAHYTIHTLADGRTRLVIRNDESGDVLGGVGPTLADAVAQLEDKVGVNR